MTDFGIDPGTGVPEPPRPPLFIPTETRMFFRFIVWASDAIDAKPVDSVCILKDGSKGNSFIYPDGLSSEQLTMAVDWMRELKRNPYRRAVALREYLH